MRHACVVRLKEADLPTLIRAAQCDEPRAVDTLLGTIRPSLIRYFNRRLAYDLAEDLAQVALVRTTRALPRIDARGASAFIAKIAQDLLRSACSSQVRDERRYASTASIDQIESSNASHAEAEELHLITTVRSASERALPRELREIIFAVLQGRGDDEIAASQGINLATVHTRLMRARDILRTELARELAPRYARRTGMDDTPNLPA